MRLKKDTETQFHAVPTVKGPVMVPYVIRRSKRSRRIYISLDDQHQALLTIPARVSCKAALTFLNQCGDWLTEQMAKTPRPKSILEHLRDYPSVTLNGRKCSVAFGITNRCPYCEYKRSEGKLVLFYDPHAVNELRIREALKQVARECLPKRIHYLCEKKSIRPPSRVTVRDQSSRWGSCSSSRSLSLNWQLILLDPGLQDYVILHELAHLKEMNHSPSFWNLLNKYDSRSKYHDRLLNEVGRGIISLR